MLSSQSIGRLLIALPWIVLLPAPSAAADSGAAGGTRYESRPVVTALECVSGERSSCSQGQLLRVRGEWLEQSASVVFLGRSGAGDDRRVRPEERSPHRVLVRVPDGARTGPVRVAARGMGYSRPSGRLRIARPAPVAVAVPPGEGVFPVRGRYDFGSAVNRFGGGRGHQGQDILAACSTPIVAARSGEVTTAASEARAGNYVVITAADGTSQAYLHMLAPASVDVGDRVAAGQPIGLVGETGRASACHLHYESWTAPGWRTGGEPVDPLPELQQFAQRG